LHLVDNTGNDANITTAALSVCHYPSCEECACDAEKKRKECEKRVSCTQHSQGETECHLDLYIR